MPVSPARHLAFDVLTAVGEGGYAADLLHSTWARGLALPDRRLATEIVMGVLRFRAQLDYVIERAARRTAARIDTVALTALRIGVYQLRFLSRVPASAAVHESVEMTKEHAPQLAGFVNAVLRHASGEPIAALLAAEPDLKRRREVEFSHPAWLLERWSRNFSPEMAARIAEFDNDVPPVAIRFTTDAADAALPEEIVMAPGRLLRSALRVTSGDITKTEAYRAGRVWVQDEASQLVAHLLDPSSRHRILDACAAPGGKTALLAALAPEAGVVAVEVHPHRARLLRRRMPATVHVVGADATRPLPFRRGFDRILVDAPCTGTGTLARNPEIRWRLTPSDPVRLAALQMAILKATVQALEPGGRLVYSVCSIEPEEGPGVIAALLAANSQLGIVPAGRVLDALEAAGQLAEDHPPLTAITAGPYLRILPGAAATDGFFAAVIERGR